MSQMKENNTKPFITKQTKQLYSALTKQGIRATLEYSDGHKHVDIAILQAKIFIEVDGLHHYTDPKQIESDFSRDHYSDGDDFCTFRIPNIVIEKYLNQVVRAIVALVKKRSK